MGGTFNAHVGDEKLWLESVRERDHMQDLGVDERIILKFILSKNIGF
jgi:hypothetical protein